MKYILILIQRIVRFISCSVFLILAKVLLFLWDGKFKRYLKNSLPKRLNKFGVEFYYATLWDYAIGKTSFYQYFNGGYRGTLKKGFPYIVKGKTRAFTYKIK